MKVLCFYASQFSFTIGDKNHEEADETQTTTFGYFLNLNMEAPGSSMARVWADF